MCESDAYIKTGQGEEPFMTQVVSIRSLAPGEIKLENLTGEQKIFRGKVTQIDFTGHKIWLTTEK